MSDDYTGYEDDPTAHDGYATEAHDPAGGFGDLLGQPLTEIGQYDQAGHDDTATYPAEETPADPYASDGQEHGTTDGYATGFPGTDAQADPYATDGHAEGEYPAQQPASEADPYATDAGDRGGRDAFEASGQNPSGT